MALSVGVRLGPYEILEPLGAGGMGEVYRARDPRLKRDVALKILPAALASEPERLERFQREAEALAALNHPHIVTIHSVEETEGVRFLTMELVEGRSLSRVIPRGGLTLSRFFQIAIPLSEAVSAAHEKGIIHRDLKPGNVMVTREDRVKVLDFGLAKLREGARGAADSRSPTEPATGAGRILGTAPYMSPEQVQGRALDHRSDVFSLGVILYEMATGERPFGGDTFADVASSILRDTPRSVTDIRYDLPRDIARLVNRCLEKEPKRRVQSVLDLHNELEDLKREADSGALLSAEQALRAGRPRRRTRWLGAAATLVILCTALGGWWLSSRRAPEIPTVPVSITPFTTDGGRKYGPRLSPDGEKVVYGWAGPSGNNLDVYVKPLGRGARPIRLTEHPAIDAVPVWSPDGRRIAFGRLFEDGAAGIYTIPSLGGQERKLIDISGAFMAGTHLVPTWSWSPDGTWLALAEKDPEDAPARIVRLSLETLEKRPLTSPPEGSGGDLFPALCPDGTLLAFVRSDNPTGLHTDVWVQPLEGGEARRLTSKGFERCDHLTWTPAGDEILFTANDRVLRVSLAGGEPEPVVGVGQNSSSPSIRGRRMVYVQAAQWPYDIWRLPGRKTPPPERAPERLIASSGDDTFPVYSPDGRRIALSSTRNGVLNVWTCEEDGSNAVQLTEFEAHTGSPHWSPDGRRLVFNSVEKGDWNLYVIDAEGGVPRQLTFEPSDENDPFWSRDGRWVYFSSDRSGRREIWRVPAEGGDWVQVTRAGGCRPREGLDNRFLYYSKDFGQTSIWRVRADGGEETEILSGPVAHHDWAVARGGIYFAKTDEGWAIHLLDLESGRVTELFRKGDRFVHYSFAVSPDEEWVLYGEGPPPTSEVMLLENFR